MSGHLVCNVNDSKYIKLSGVYADSKFSISCQNYMALISLLHSDLIKDNAKWFATLKHLNEYCTHSWKVLCKYRI